MIIPNLDLVPRPTPPFERRAKGGLVPRSLPDFILQPCIKSGSGPDEAICYILVS